MAKQVSLFQCFGQAEPGNRNGAKKRPTENREQYEKKRQRKFLPSWTENRPWLKVDESGSVMFCQACKDNNYGLADPGSALTTGTTSLRLDSVTTHEKSMKHQREMEADRAANTPKGNAPAFKMLAAMNRKRLDMLLLKFRNVHALAKHNRPYTDYVWMNNLDGLKGLDISSEYKSDKAAATFAHHIAEIERERLLEEVTQAKFAAIIMDGSTDTSCIEQEMIYIRSCSAGCISVKFLGIIDTPKADAEGILKSLEKGIRRGLGFEMEDFGRKLVAMGTDGAAVMVGRHNGVVTKVRERFASSLVGVHCFAHRLELASKDVVKQHPLYDGFEQLLKDLFKFYKKGNLNLANLKTSCQLLHVKQLVPTRVGGTRWLPHTLRAMNNLWEIYPALVQHLAEVKEGGQSGIAKAKASGLLQKLCSRSCVEFGHFLWDIVIGLSKLSLFLQTRECCVAEVADHVDALVAILEKYSDECGPKLSKVRGLVEFKGITLTEDTRRTAIARDVIDQEQHSLCEDLLASITNRFDMEDSIVSATGIVNKQSWPDTLEDAKDFGNEDIEVLMNHFENILQHADVDADQIISDWTKLKTILYKRKHTTFRTMTWSHINRQYYNIAPHFLKLVDLIYTMPSTSAEAERGFSVMKLIKTDTRNRLREKSMNILLRIKLLSPPESEFDPEPSVDHWMRAARRRERRSGQVGPPTSDADSSEEEDSSSETDDSGDLDLEELLKAS